MSLGARQALDSPRDALPMPAGPGPPAAPQQRPSSTRSVPNQWPTRALPARYQHPASAFVGTAACGAAAAASLPEQVERQSALQAAHPSHGGAGEAGQLANSCPQLSEHLNRTCIAGVQVGAPAESPIGAPGEKPEPAQELMGRSEVRQECSLGSSLPGNRIPTLPNSQGFSGAGLPEGCVQTGLLQADALGCGPCERGSLDSSARAPAAPGPADGLHPAGGSSGLAMGGLMAGVAGAGIARVPGCLAAPERAASGLCLRRSVEEALVPPRSVEEAPVPPRCASPSLPLSARMGAENLSPTSPKRTAGKRRPLSSKGRAAEAAGSDAGSNGADQHEGAEAVVDFLRPRRQSTCDSSPRRIGVGWPRNPRLAPLVRTGSGASWGSGSAASLSAEGSHRGSLRASAENSPISMRGAGELVDSCATELGLLRDGAPAEGRDPVAERSESAGAEALTDSCATGLGLFRGTAPAGRDMSAAHIEAAGAGSPAALDLAGARRAWAALMCSLAPRGREELPSGTLLAGAAWGTALSVAPEAAMARAVQPLTVVNVEAAAGAGGDRGGAVLEAVSALLQHARLAEDIHGCICECGLPLIKHNAFTDALRQPKCLYDSRYCGQRYLTLLHACV